MQKLNRRVLVALGAAGAAGVGVGPAKASAAAGPPAPLTPQTTEGPYYLDAVHMRADIAEGLPGVPLDVRIAVLDLAGAPLAGARVDIWHSDPAGRYSGFGGDPGEAPDPAVAKATFLRGAQTTDAAGAVVFHTIYPGWYPGRTPHIHFKVWNGPRAVLTCQFFLPDALSEFIFANAAAYKRARLRDTLNRTDGIAIEAGERTVGSVAQMGERYLASLTAVVDPSAEPVVDRPPRPPMGHGFPPGPPGFPPPPGAHGPRPGFGPGHGPGPDGRGPPPGGFPGHVELTGEARVEGLLPGKALI